MKRRHLHVVPDTAPRQMTLLHGAIGAEARGADVEPIPDRDAELTQRLDVMRERLRARGGSG